MIHADAHTVCLADKAVAPDVGMASEEDFLEGLDLRSEPFEDWRREAAAGLQAPGSARAASHDIFENPSVLVTGFTPASETSEDMSFATGLVIDLRSSLSMWRWFPLIGPEAIGWKTDRDGNLRDLAGSVGADYAISGAIRRSGDRIRVSVGLTETENGHLVWSESFDGEMSDLFEMQEAIGRAVVARVTPEIGRAEAARIVRKRPANLSAWQLVAQTDELERTGGEGYGTRAANEAQVPLLEEAIRLDPDYARAWARLGRHYFRATLLGWIEDREAGFGRALECCEKAVVLDPTEWEGQATIALTMIFGTRDFGSGRFHALEAVRLNPSAPFARHASGCALEWTGEAESALHHLEKVFDLNPRFPNRAAVLGDITTCQMFTGRMEQAVETARQLRDIAPDYCRGLQRVAVTLGNAGEIEEAKLALARVFEMLPDFDETYVRETYPYSESRHFEMILAGLRRAGWTG